MKELPLNVNNYNQFSNLWRRWENFRDSIVDHNMPVPDVILNHPQEFFTSAFLWYVVVLERVYRWFTGGQYDIRNFIDAVDILVSSTIGMFSDRTSGKNQYYYQLIESLRDLVNANDKIAEEFCCSRLWSENLRTDSREHNEHSYNLPSGEIRLNDLWNQFDGGVFFEAERFERLINMLSSGKISLTADEVSSFYDSIENLLHPDRLRRALLSGGYFNLLLLSDRQQDIEKFYQIFTDCRLYTALGRNREVLYYLDGVLGLLRRKLTPQQLYKIVEKVVQQLKRGEEDEEISVFVQQMHNGNINHLQRFFEGLSNNNISPAVITVSYNMISGWLDAVHPDIIEERFVDEIRKIYSNETFRGNFNNIVKTSIERLQQNQNIDNNESLFSSREFVFCWFLLKSYTKVALETFMSRCGNLYQRRNL